MSCSHDDRLLDLVLGEIPAEEAAALRAEALECPDCQDSLAELELGAALAARLPMEEPPDAMDAVIMAAAREKAEAMASERAKVAPVAPEPKADPSADPGPRSLWERIKDWGSGITLGPQLAMASVMVLVVSIGLFYLPKGGGDTVARTAVTPDPEGEAISALPEPSMDPSAPAEEGAQAALEVPAAEEDADEASGPRVFGSENRAGASGRYRSGQDLADDRLDRLARTDEPEPEPEASARRPSSPRQQRQARAEAQSAQLADDEALPSFDGEATNAGVPAPGGVPSQQAPRPSATRSSSYEQGVGTYRGGMDPEGAATSFRNGEREEAQRAEPNSDRQVIPVMIHQRARSHKQNRDFQTAVNVYEDLLQRFPSYSQLPQAMVEAAECYRLMGRLRQARALLERAKRYAATRALASRELQRIETLERASRRRARPSAADSYEAAEAF